MAYDQWWLYGLLADATAARDALADAGFEVAPPKDQPVEVINDTGAPDGAFRVVFRVGSEPAVPDNVKRARMRFGMAAIGTF